MSRTCNSMHPKLRHAAAGRGEGTVRHQRSAPRLPHQARPAAGFFRLDLQPLSTDRPCVFYPRLLEALYNSTISQLSTKQNARTCPHIFLASWEIVPKHSPLVFEACRPWSSSPRHNQHSETYTPCLAFTHSVVASVDTLENR